MNAEKANEILAILAKSKYKLTNQDDFGSELESHDGTNRVQVQSTTVTFTSTSNKDCAYSFGADPKAVRGFLSKTHSWELADGPVEEAPKTKKEKAAKAEKAPKPANESKAPKAKADPVKSVVNTTPSAVVIDGVRTPVSKWREVATVTLEAISKDNDKFIKVLIALPKFVGNTVDGFRKPKVLENGAFYETNLSASVINHLSEKAAAVAGVKLGVEYAETPAVEAKPAPAETKIEAPVAEPAVA